MKNPQFLTNFAQTFRDSSIHGEFHPWKFELDWLKIVYFSLIAFKVAIPKRGAQVCTKEDINLPMTNVVSAWKKKLYILG